MSSFRTRVADTDSTWLLLPEQVVSSAKEINVPHVEDEDGSEDTK